VTELLSQLLDSVGEGLVVLSSTSQSVVWHNQQACDLLAFSPQLLLTETWQALVERLSAQLSEDSPQPALLVLPTEGRASGRLVFRDDRALDFTLGKLPLEPDRWLLQLRDVTSVLATERSLHRSDAVLQNVIDEQQHLLSMVRQLGTPVLPIYQRIVVLPLVGHLDSGRADHVMDAVLSAIVRYQAEVVIIDITGVALVDTAVANSLLQTVRAADLIGTLSILVGISAEVARSMVHLGVGLDRVVTRRDLQAGIAYALRHTGHAIVEVREEIDWLSTFVAEKRILAPGGPESKPVVKSDAASVSADRS
jgi:anti-anti-sigma regulatory factor